MKNLIVWVLVLSAATYGAAKAYLHKEVGDAMDMVVLMMSPYANVEYGGVRSTMSGELTIENIHIRMHEFRDDIEIERLGIDTPSFLYLVDFLSLPGRHERLHQDAK